LHVDLAAGIIDLGNPAIDWVLLARSMGVEGERVTSLRDLQEKLSASLRASGPRLLEVPIGLRA
jgi:acetolactate synthase I/II/III large subunit